MTYSAQLSHVNGDKSVSFTASGASDDEAGKRCGLSFNPGGHEPTERIKTACAVAMKTIINEREALRLPDSGELAPNVARCFATALTHLEAAQMFAVKGLHQ